VSRIFIYLIMYITCIIISKYQRCTVRSRGGSIVSNKKLQGKLKPVHGLREGYIKTAQKRQNNQLFQHKRKRFKIKLNTIPYSRCWGKLERASHAVHVACAVYCTIYEKKSNKPTRTNYFCLKKTIETTDNSSIKD
jgi:hypothetical protein